MPMPGPASDLQTPTSGRGPGVLSLKTAAGTAGTADAPLLGDGLGPRLPWRMPPPSQLPPLTEISRHTPLSPGRPSWSAPPRPSGWPLEPRPSGSLLQLPPSLTGLPPPSPAQTSPVGSQGPLSAFPEEEGPPGRLWGGGGARGFPYLRGTACAPAGCCRTGTGSHRHRRCMVLGREGETRGSCVRGRRTPDARELGLWAQPVCPCH